jgi:hypothetical protein
MTTRKNSTRKPRKQAPVIPAEGRFIAYDMTTGDYLAALDGQYVGHYRDYVSADHVINELAYAAAARRRDETRAAQLDASLADFERRCIAIGL